MFTLLPSLSVAGLLLDYSKYCIPAKGAMAMAWAGLHNGKPLLL
jgi:hypothetical protein